MSGTVDLDLAGIEIRARAATPGPWVTRDECGRVDGRFITPETASAVACALGYHGVRAFDDAAHIAGLSPDVALALVARLRALEAERDAMREALRPFAAYVEAVNPESAMSDRSELGGAITGAFRRSITFGHMRRAAALIQSTAETEDRVDPFSPLGSVEWLQREVGHVPFVSSHLGRLRKALSAKPDAEPLAKSGRWLAPVDAATAEDLKQKGWRHLGRGIWQEPEALDQADARKTS